MMDKARRKSIRLRGYDYSQTGMYFVTICTQDRIHLFGKIDNGKMILNDAGRLALFTWNDLPEHNANISLDYFTVMPNHVHGIIIINDINVGAGSKPAQLGSKPAHFGIGSKPAHFGIGSKPARHNRAGYEPAPTHGLPEIIRQFKTFSSKRTNKNRHTPKTPVWQRNYYDHVIRDEIELNKIRQYIQNNPSTWEKDENNIVLN